MSTKYRSVGHEILMDYSIEGCLFLVRVEHSVQLRARRGNLTRFVNHEVLAGKIR